MRSFCIFCILDGSVLAAKDDPGVPYTYAHTYILPGSVLAAKGDPGVPYTYIHTYILRYPDQFWLQKVIRAYLMYTFIRIYYPGSVLAAKSYPGVPYDQFWQ